MHRLMVLIVLIVLVFASVSSAAAQTTPTVPEPETPADNLCYEGGAWADGRCTSDLAWVCGWYMARYFAGTYSAEQVGPECEHHVKQPKRVPV